MATVPSITRLIDSYFLSTWEEIQAESWDNALLATPLMAALKTKGCWKTQVGGYKIDRTIQYDVMTRIGYSKGDPVPADAKETETMAQWPFRNTVAGISRTLVDDAANQGIDKIKDYVKTRTRDMMDALSQGFELDLFSAFDSTESGKNLPIGLNDLLPAFNNKAAGTYGGIARNNVNSAGLQWWIPKYRLLQTPIEITLEDDLRSMWNDISLNYEAPNLGFWDRTLYETYEAQALDRVQIIKTASGNAMFDLGFTGCYYKQAEVYWSPNVQATDALFLNTRWLEFVRDPTVWFYKTDWKESPNQLERAMQCVCRYGLISRQPRRHGRLYSSAASSAGAAGAD